MFLTTFGNHFNNISGIKREKFFIFFSNSFRFNIFIVRCLWGSFFHALCSSCCCLGYNVSDGAPGDTQSVNEDCRVRWSWLSERAVWLRSGKHWRRQLGRISRLVRRHWLSILKTN